MLVTLALFATAAAAGLIDAMAGGGGLITVPALALAGFDPVTALATNKLQGSFGSGSAALAFARAGRIDLRLMWPVALASAAGAFAGALALTHVPRDAATVALPFVLVGVALYFALSRRIGEEDVRQRLPAPAVLATVVPLVGFYDGVFGPGTGSFFTMGFVELLGYGLLKATAHAKLANFASNVTALVLLAFSGHVVVGLGLVMGLGQVLGARVGVHLTMRHGTRLLRPMIVVACCALALRLALVPSHPVGAWLTRHAGV